MKPFHFNPLNIRQARDIRNSLARSFLKALAEKNASVFIRFGVEFLGKNLGTDYDNYIKTRLAKYEEAFAIIEQGELRGILQQAEIFWDLELYFELHELLEFSWKEAEGNRRKALQGLIRAAGMKIHGENNNWKAVLSMGAKAQADLLMYRGELKGLTKLDAILTEIKQTLAISQKTTQAD